MPHHSQRTVRSIPVAALLHRADVEHHIRHPLEWKGSASTLGWRLPLIRFVTDSKVRLGEA